MRWSKIGPYGTGMKYENEVGEQRGIPFHRSLIVSTKLDKDTGIKKLCGICD
jgi:hypothetical protein